MGVYMLELVGKEGVDEGVEIAQESHQRPNCLAKSILMPGNAVAQTTGDLLSPAIGLTGTFQSKCSFSGTQPLSGCGFH